MSQHHSLVKLISIIALSFSGLSFAQGQEPNQKADSMPEHSPHAWCDKNPEKCAQAKQRHEEFCKQNPKRCEEMNAKHEEMREKCKQDPEACKKKHEERKERRAAHRKELCDKNPEKCAEMKAHHHKEMNSEPTSAAPAQK